MIDAHPSTVKTILQTLLDTRGEAVRRWLTEAFIHTPPSFYSSVDIRHSGSKLVPVDTNLFPAGFNHLSDPSRQEAVRYIQGFMARLAHPVARILVIPENHTRNIGYLDNLHALTTLLTLAGYEVQIGRLDAPPGEIVGLETSEGVAIIQYPLIKRANSIETHLGFRPDLIIMNNDMTSGEPELLKGVTQTIVPSLGQGWYRRKKSIHFEAYRQVAYQFAEAFSIDPWLIVAHHHKCGRISFRERTGIECVALGVEKVLRHVAQKYDEYGISETPYVFIKADSGTYGMGIMTARSGEEVLEMNKKVRNKMNAIKEGVQTTEVIIQEGVPTIDRIDGAMAEPMVYLIDGHPLGGAYRVNDERDQYNNLNAAGMRFEPMCEAESRICMSRSPIALISQLATLAASREEYGEDYMI